MFILADLQSALDKFRFFLPSLWRRLEPYRVGFLLGILSLSATLVLIITGQRSEKLTLETVRVQPHPVKSGLDGSSAGEGKEVLGRKSSAIGSLDGKVTKERFPNQGKLNINKATALMLESLPRIGPTIAQRIVDYRTANGPFRSLEELDKVKGIGKKILEKIRPLVTVE